MWLSTNAVREARTLNYRGQYHQQMPVFIALVLLIIGTGWHTPIYAESFTVKNGETAGTKTLNNANETGIIEAGGTISTTGITAFGIESTGTDVTITNNGAITTMGNNADGIRSTGTDATITNNGAITTTGDFSAGIISGGADAVIINSGAITTTGSVAIGINAAGADAVIINSGSIHVSGSNANGVNLDDFFGTSNTLNNSGSIIATGAATRAIIGGGGSNTLNLLTGSRIIGEINLAGGNDTVNVLGLPLGSAQMTFTNAENITLAAGLPGVVVGNVVTTVDPTGQSVQGVALSNFTSAFHSVISQRMVQTAALAPIQLASLELSPGMLFQEREPIVWGEMFGSHRTRGTDGNVLSHTHDYKGFTGGYERDYNKARLGMMAGFANASVSTDSDSINTDTDSFFAGVYGHWYFDKVNVTTALAGGVESHDNDRTVVDNLNGIETARSDFSSVFFSPSVTLSSAYTLNEMFEFRPSATLTYNVAWYEDYAETGTTRSNLFIDDRTSQSLHGRVQLAVAMALNDISEFELRTGFTTRHTDDDDVNANLAGTNFSYASASDDSVQGGFVGGNLRFNATDRLDVLADVAYHRASGDEEDISARLRFEYRF